MNITPENPSQKLIWISLAANLFFCVTILPLVLHPGLVLSGRQLIDTLFWQGISFIGWPLAMVGSSLNYLYNGYMPDLRTTLSISIYPFIWLAVFLLIFLKRKKWIPLLLTHILVLISFIITWNAVLKGYNFMVG